VQDAMVFSHTNMAQLLVEYVFQALALNPTHATAWDNLGALGGGKLDGMHYPATQCFERALAWDPKCGNAWYNLGTHGGGTVGKEQRDPIECFQEALLLNPTDSQAWYNLGIHAGAQRNAMKDVVDEESNSKQLNLKPPSPQECFEKAVAIEPTDADFWHNLGVVGGGSVAGKDYDKIECLQIVNALKPKDESQPPGKLPSVMQGASDQSPARSLHVGHKYKLTPPGNFPIYDHSRIESVRDSVVQESSEHSPARFAHSDCNKNKDTPETPGKLPIYSPGLYELDMAAEAVQSPVAREASDQSSAGALRDGRDDFDTADDFGMPVGHAARKFEFKPMVKLKGKRKVWSKDNFAAIGKNIREERKCRQKDAIIWLCMGSGVAFALFRFRTGSLFSTVCP